jgi:hypothetical protein
VRLPPQTLRLTTAGRMACSARWFVAAIVGSITFTAQFLDEAQQLLHLAFELRDSLLGNPQLLAESLIVVEQFLIRWMAQYAGTGFRFRRVHTSSTTRITLADQ